MEMQKHKFPYKLEAFRSQIQRKIKAKYSLALRVVVALQWVTS